ncbi:MAG TPA: hypothetical protein VJ279_03670, partial [Hanamia sp.]|nr:hypothetical protein [Hanamia sp.]
MQKIYRPSTYEKDVQEIRRSNKIDDEDLKILVKYIVVARISKNDLSGQTYEDILNRIKTFRQENEKMDVREDMEKEARRNKLSSQLEASLLKKEYSNKEGKEIMIYTVTLKNISSQKIKTVTGNFLLNDLLEKPVKQLNIFVDEEINPGQTFTKIITIPYHNADGTDQRVRGKDLIDMRVVWNP